MDRIYRKGKKNLGEVNLERPYWRNMILAMLLGKWLGLLDQDYVFCGSKHQRHYPEKRKYLPKQGCIMEKILAYTAMNL